MSNPFAAIGHYFENFFKGLFGQLKITVTAFLKDFVKEDLGKIAVDAVAYVEATLEGASGLEKRDAAVLKLTSDAVAAGVDVAKFAKSTLIFFVETALQAFQSGAAKLDNPDAPAAPTVPTGN